MTRKTMTRKAMPPKSMISKSIPKKFMTSKVMIPEAMISEAAPSKACSAENTVSSRSASAVRFLPLAAVLSAVLLLLIFPETGHAGMREGISLCLNALIPSVFPFLVLTPLLAAYGQALPGLPVLPLAFGIGMTAGFPLGALAVISLYEARAVDRDTAERALAVCSGAGPAFLVGCAGKTFAGSAAVGWCYVLAQFCASLVLYVLFLRGKKAVPVRSPSAPPTLVSAVTEGAKKMGNVCAFVLFFSVWNRYLSAFCEKCGVSPVISAMLCGCTEMTGGLAMLSELSAAFHTATAFPTAGAASALGMAPTLGAFPALGALPAGGGFLPLSAFLIGFGGLCVCMQTRVFAGRAGLSMRYWLPQKLLCGGLCAMFFVLFLYLFD